MICDKIVINNDQVVQLQLSTGLAERPLWSALEALPLYQAVQWVARFSPNESLSAQWALSLAVEGALGVEVPARAQALRALHAEMQRVVWCSQYLEKVFLSIEYSWRGSRFARCTELGLQYFDQFLGARVIPHWFRIGGVERDLSIGEVRKAKDMVQNIETWFNKGLDAISADWIVEERLSGVLPLSYEFMQGMMVGGAVGQASGLRWDLREVDSYGFYKNLKIKYLNNEQQMETEERLSGDVYLRLQSVIFQARQSFRLVREMLDALPEGPYLQQVEVRTLPDGFWTAGVEAPTGPMYAAISEGAIRLASTSTRMAGVMDKLLEGVHEQDLNLAIASLGYDPMQGDLS